MADQRGYELTTGVINWDDDLYFNTDKLGIARAVKYKASVLKGHLKVGDQQYTEENYVTNDETLTESVDQLDMALNDVTAAVSAITSLKTVKITLTSGQVAALGSAVMLLNNGGADTSYQVIDIKWAINVDTVLDVGEQNLEIYFEDSDSYFALIRNVNLEKVARYPMGVQIQSEHELGVNKKIYCKLSDDINPISGSATMDFWVVYQAISLTPIS